MRKNIQQLGFVLLLFLSAVTYGEAQSKYNLLLVLSGTEQNPPVATSGYGIGWGVLDLNSRTLTYAIAYDSLSGPPTAAHFHFGESGVNGPPVHTITFDANGVAQGEWTNIPDSMLAHFLNGKIYCNIHTSAHGGGEIRSQFETGGPFAFTFLAEGANEVPPVNKNGKAVGFAVLTSNIISVQGVFKGLSGSPTGMHLHYGAAGQTGGVAISLANVGSLITGINPMPNDSSYRKLFSGELYFNIHTSAHPGGELRGQLMGNRFYPFKATMSGAQAVPSNNSTAQGLFLLRYDAQRKVIEYGSQLVGVNNISGAHIHAGAIGENGSVMIPLSYNSQGKAETQDNGVSVADSVLRRLSKTEAYVNVHTSAFPGGEIRGQLISAHTVAVSFLDSSEQVPVTNTSGVGAAVFEFSAGSNSGNDMNYTVLVNGLKGTVSGSHIHAGESGQTGNVVLPLTVNMIDATVSNVADTTMIQLLRGLKHYVNVHTSAYPNGEIRGQVFPIDGTDTGPNSVKPEKLNSTVPDKFVLDQNYPNPFNPSTTINYHLPVTADVTLKVFDMLGREVTTLVHAQQDAGSYAVRFEATSFSSGLYFYQLKAGTIVQTKKMLLLR